MIFWGYWMFLSPPTLESIIAGANWLNSIESSLREASALLVLCSRASLNRPWVNFEVGAAWIKSIPIVPVCHSGLRLGELPIPLSLFHGIEANAEGGVKRIYALVAEKLASHLPQKDLSAFVDEVRKFESVYAPQIKKAFGAEMDRRALALGRECMRRSQIQTKSGGQSRDWRSWVVSPRTKHLSYWCKIQT